MLHLKTFVVFVVYFIYLFHQCVAFPLWAEKNPLSYLYDWLICYCFTFTFYHSCTVASVLWNNITFVRKRLTYEDSIIICFHAFHNIHYQAMLPDMGLWMGEFWERKKSITGISNGFVLYIHLKRVSPLLSFKKG